MKTTYIVVTFNRPEQYNCHLLAFSSPGWIIRMPWMPPCFSLFLIFYIYCSQLGNRSKRRRRAAVVLVTVKGWTTKFGWNKKSCAVFVFSFFFLIKNISLLWNRDTWLTLSFFVYCLLISPVLNPQWEGRIIKPFDGRKCLMTPQFIATFKT